ncbi:MAG: glycosyltransferase family 2 protein [Nibricoccus sp.]
MTTSLSIVIVAWRSVKDIGPCLHSLYEDGWGNDVEVDCVIVDNSLNEDGTGDFVRREFPQVKYVLPPANLGFGAGNNLGFAQTSDEYVLFLNPDTICNAAALEHCLKRLRNEPGIGLISPKLVQADGFMDLACRRSIPTIWDGFCRGSGLAATFPKKRTFSGYNLTHLPEGGTYDVGAINGAFMMGRRTVFAAVAEPAPNGVFDKRFFMYGDDLDLCIRVARAGYRIVYDGRVSITHLKGQSVAQDYSRMSSAIFDANRDVYLKHFNPHNSRLVRWKYVFAFGLWKNFARFRARLRGHRKVRPL